LSASPPSLVLIKLGGSLITDKRRAATPRPRRLSHLAQQLASRRLGGPAPVLGHGSGSFGHPAAALYRLQDGISSHRQLEGVSRTQGLARELHRLVVGTLERAGALPFSLPPGAFMVAEQGEPVVTCPEPLLRALDLGLLPVVFGDVVTDRQRGIAICSTEAVFLTLARDLLRAGRRIDRALWLGDTPGLLDPAGRTIATVDSSIWSSLRREVAPASGVDVTGGMALRVETALALAALGIESWILDGRPRGALSGALTGESLAGTHVPAMVASAGADPPPPRPRA
jgi:isopentenyl phosphate kinase